MKNVKAGEETGLAVVNLEVAEEAKAGIIEGFVRGALGFVAAAMIGPVQTPKPLPEPQAVPFRYAGVTGTITSSLKGVADLVGRHLTLSLQAAEGDDEARQILLDETSALIEGVERQFPF